MTYTPPPPTNYYQQPQQWPPPQPPKKKRNPLVLLLALFGGFVVLVIGVNTVNSFLYPIDAPSNSSPALVKADIADTNKTDYESVTDRDYAVIAKDPDAHRGRKVIVYGDVFQADSRIGANDIKIDARGEERSLLFEQNTHVVGSPESFRDVVKGDEVKVWATVLGEYEYTSVSDKKIRVPMLQANVIEVIPNP
ncbi:hypothetical protein 7S3_28 [uncultured Caudovirales phage]|uniref:tRNA_anti-like n=1 Tax=uncultured Caudovirales phage TaxID=2100421 RepID=A0A2H4J9M0_9CAUD|nr:hypothetical protein 7S3_28 [uncultured Caudovirales phage]